MAKTADRTAFLAANEIRLRIAEWCAAEALTREEIAARLRRASGGLSAPATMVRHGALRSVGLTSPGVNGRRAELLRLAPGWRKALRDAQRLRTPNEIGPGSDLLLVSLGDTEAACAELAADPTNIHWGAELHGERLGLLLVPHRDERNAATVRAVAGLQRAGVQPLRVRLGQPMAASELESWARAIAPPLRGSLPGL